MPGIKTEESWIPWGVKQPQSPGMYWWRLQSAVLPELTLIFAASLKTCNGVTVPPFYHWNEWKAVVPPCEWKPAPEVPVSSHGEYSLSIENLEFQRCPFCGKIPTLNGYRWAADGGVIITASPQVLSAGRGGRHQPSDVRPEKRDARYFRRSGAGQGRTYPGRHAG